MEGSHNGSEMLLEDIDYSLIEGDIALLYDEIKDAMSEDEVSSEESNDIGFKTDRKLKTPSEENESKNIETLVEENVQTLPYSFVNVCVKTEILPAASENSPDTDTNFPSSKPQTVVETTSWDLENPDCSSLDFMHETVTSGRYNTPNMSESANKSRLSGDTPTLQSKIKCESKECLDDIHETVTNGFNDTPNTNDSSKKSDASSDTPKSQSEKKCKLKKGLGSLDILKTVTGGFIDTPNTNESSKKSYASADTKSQSEKKCNLKKCLEEATKKLIQKGAKNNDGNSKPKNGGSSSVEELDKKSGVQEGPGVGSVQLKLPQKKKHALNEYEAEYELTGVPGVIVDYVLSKGVAQKFIKGISRAAVSVSGSVLTSASGLQEAPLHLLVQGPTKQSVHLAIQLVKFLKSKGEEINQISISDKSEKKVVVKKIGEKIVETQNGGNEENDNKRLSRKTHLTITKKQEKSPVSCSITSKNIGLTIKKKLDPNKPIEQVLEQNKVKKGKIQLKEIMRSETKVGEQFRLNCGLKEDTQTYFQKDSFEEMKVLNGITMKDKRRTKDTQRELCNFQKIQPDNSGKRKEILYKSVDMKKEKVKLNEKEKDTEREFNNFQKVHPDDTRKRIELLHKIQETKKDQIEEKLKLNEKEKDSRRESYNFQKVHPDDTQKRIEILHKIRGMKKDQLEEMLKLNEKEKENLVENVNAVGKSPVNKEKDHIEQKRKYDVSDENKRKKMKTDTDEIGSKKELKEEGTIETCVKMEEENKDKLEQQSETSMHVPEENEILKRTMDKQMDFIQKLVVGKVLNEEERKYLSLAQKAQQFRIESEDMEKVVVGLEQAPPSFDVVSRVEGPEGVYLQYISDCSETHLTLRGKGSGFLEESTGQESTEPLHICIQHFHAHKDPRCISKAKRLATELITTIKQEYQQLCLQSDTPDWKPKSSSETDQDESGNPVPLQYPVFQHQHPPNSHPNHLSPYKENLDLLQTPTGSAAPSSLMSGNNKMEIFPATSSCSSTCFPNDGYTSFPTSMGPTVSKTHLTTIAHQEITQLSSKVSLTPPKASPGAPRISLPNLMQGAPLQMVQAPPLTKDSLPDQPSNESTCFDHRPLPNVPFGSSDSCQLRMCETPTIESQVFHKPPPNALQPFSQPSSGFEAAKSEFYNPPVSYQHTLSSGASQFFLNQPSSAVSQPSQPPVHSKTSESQFVLNQPPRAMPPPFQTPLHSKTSESQFFHNSPPSAMPPPTQPPIGSKPSEYQFFHNPPPSLMPPPSQPPSHSKTSESQFFLNQPPSAMPTPTQLPLSSQPSESQFFPNPPHVAVPPPFQPPSASTASQLFHNPPPSVMNSPCQPPILSASLDSQFFHNPPPSVNSPSSQPPTGSAPTPSQFFHNPPPSVMNSPCQPPIVSASLDSQFFHNPPPSVNSPSSQPPTGSAPTPSQFFHNPPPSVINSPCQPPIVSASLDSQFFHNPPPSVMNSPCQPPIVSASLDSQFFHNPPPSVISLSSQPPNGSAPTPSQFFHSPSSSVIPHFPQSSSDPVSFNQQQAQMIPQQNFALPFYKASPSSNLPMYCQPNALTQENSSFSQPSTPAAVSQSQSTLTPPTFHPQSLTYMPPAQIFSTESTVFQPQLIHTPLLQSTCSLSQAPSLIQSAHSSQIIQSSVTPSQGSNQSQPPPMVFLSQITATSFSTATMNQNLTPLPGSFSVKPVPPPGKDLLQKFGLECSSEANQTKKSSRWDVDRTLSKTMLRLPVEGNTPTMEEQTAEAKMKRTLQLMEETSGPAIKSGAQHPETSSPQNSNSSLTTLDIINIKRTLEDMLNSLRGSLPEGLLKTKITQITLLAEHTHENGVEESEHQKKKIMILLQVLDKVFDAHRDSCLNQFRPILNQLQQTLSTATRSDSKPQVRLRSREPRPARSRSPPVSRRDNVRERCNTSKTNSKEKRDSRFNKIFQQYLKFLVMSLQSIVKSETKQIRKIILVGEQDLLRTYMKVRDEKLSEQDQTILLRTLGNLEKHSSNDRRVRRNIKMLKELVEDPSNIAVSVDKQPSKHGDAEVPTKERESYMNQASSSPRSSEDKCLVKDQRYQTMSNQGLPDLVLTTLQERATVSDSEGPTNLCDGSEPLSDNSRAVNQTTSVDLNKLMDQILKLSQQLVQNRVEKS